MNVEQLDDGSNGKSQLEKPWGRKLQEYTGIELKRNSKEPNEEYGLGQNCRRLWLASQSIQPVCGTMTQTLEKFRVQWHISVLRKKEWFKVSQNVLCLRDSISDSVNRNDGPEIYIFKQNLHLYPQVMLVQFIHATLKKIIVTFCHPGKWFHLLFDQQSQWSSLYPLCRYRWEGQKVICSFIPWMLLTPEQMEPLSPYVLWLLTPTHIYAV